MNIYKFPLPKMFGVVHIALPEGSQIIHFGAQQSVPTMWAIVNPEAPLVERRFFLLETGAEVSEKLSHIGTALFPLNLVVHLFEPVTILRGVEGDLKDELDEYISKHS